MAKAREFNFQRYYYQGVGRYEPDAAYERGLADLDVLADIVPDARFVHGAKPTSVDAGIYGFIANIHFFEIDTPLKRFVSSRPNLVSHCVAIHERVMREQSDGSNRRTAFHSHGNPRSGQRDRAFD